MPLLSKHKTVIVLSLLTIVAAVTWWAAANFFAASRVPGERHIASIKRLTAEQFTHIIDDVFGNTLATQGKLSGIGQRDGGLLAIGASHASLSPVDMEVAEDLALQVAAQVVGERYRSELIPCQPKHETDFDPACGEHFIKEVGRLLYRRPLTESELQNHLQLALQSATAKNSFYAGMERVLANMLVSPNFLYRIEYAWPDGEDQVQLTAYSKASRLSFWLWDSSPDRALLDAAQRGDLDSRSGLQEQIDRMITSPKIRRGVRAFFSDMLALDEFDTLIKDAQLFPDFTFQVTQDAREQVMRTVVDHVITRRGDYRDLFTTPRTFLTPMLASQLAIPLFQINPIATPDRWVPYEFKAGDPRAGLLAQPAFVALHSHPGRTSPTLRGKALRENLLCQEVPLPPGDVDFSLMQPGNPDYKTTRDRLSAHATNPTCAGCHKITDPIGLALESFDAGGRYRTRENGVVIDTRGELDGVSFADAAGLSQAVRNSPAIVSCVVNRVYAYGAGDDVSPRKRKWLKQIREAFADNGYQITQLFREIGGSEEFYRVEFSAPHKVAGR